MKNFKILTIDSGHLYSQPIKIQECAKKIIAQSFQDELKEDREKLKKDWETIGKDFPF